MKISYTQDQLDGLRRAFFNSVIRGGPLLIQAENVQILSEYLCCRPSRCCENGLESWTPDGWVCGECHQVKSKELDGAAPDDTALLDYLLGRCPCIPPTRNEVRVQLLRSKQEPIPYSHGEWHTGTTAPPLNPQKFLDDLARDAAEDLDEDESE